MSKNTTPSILNLPCVTRMTTIDPNSQDPITHVQSILYHSDLDEKNGITTDTTSCVSGDSEGGKSERVQFINTDDPFPESPDAPVEDRQLTVRAVVVGCILGGVVAASNIYLGLKVSCSYSPLIRRSRFLCRLDGRFLRHCLAQS